MATSKLATTVLQYDEEDFETYEVQLLALCCKDDGSNLEMLHDEPEEDSDLPLDPITEFYLMKLMQLLKWTRTSIQCGRDFKFYKIQHK